MIRSSLGLSLNGGPVLVVIAYLRGLSLKQHRWAECFRRMVMEEMERFIGIGVLYTLIYQRCLSLEFERAGLSFAREAEQTIYYEGIDVGTRRADFVVENKIIVELKALVSLDDVHLAQAKNYVVAYDFPVGLLINFGAKSLQYKKVFNAKFNQGG